MHINCFRNGRRSDTIVQIEEAPRPVKARLRRTVTSQSTTSRGSTTSNHSISSLPPCKRMSEEAEAMLMCVPPEVPSRCLRLSHPKTYSDIVESMKKERGCRNWKAFDVFDELEVDMSSSAIERGEQRAADLQKRLGKFEKASKCDIEATIDCLG